MFTGALDGSEVQAGVEIVPREWLPVQDFPSGIFMTSLPFPAAMPEVGGKREELKDMSREFPSWCSRNESD